MEFICTAKPFIFQQSAVQASFPLDCEKQSLSLFPEFDFSGLFFGQQRTDMAGRQESRNVIFASPISGKIGSLKPDALKWQAG